MAENLQLLRKRIKTAGNIAQIAKAMEMISSSKIKRAQSAVEKNRPYADRITDVVDRILGNCELKEFRHPLTEKKMSPRKLLVVIAPDKGLCGGLAANLFKKLLDYDEKATDLVTVGKKAERVSVRFDFPLLASFPMGGAFPKYAAVYPLLEIIQKQFTEGKVSSVELLFTEFKSRMQQQPAVFRLLPVALPENCETKDVPYIFEPGVETILAELLPYYVEVKLYNALIQAYTSEQAARMVAMKNAKENAFEIKDFLTQSYNRSRQERITNEILDLANGQNAS
jgi:F-type H+-transporting ATPase subunit gamma